MKFWRGINITLSKLLRDIICYKSNSSSEKLEIDDQQKCQSYQGYDSQDDQLVVFPLPIYVKYKFVAFARLLIDLVKVILHFGQLLILRL